MCIRFRELQVQAFNLVLSCFVSSMHLAVTKLAPKSILVVLLNNLTYCPAESSNALPRCTCYVQPIIPWPHRSTAHKYLISGFYVPIFQRKISSLPVHHLINLLLDIKAQVLHVLKILSLLLGSLQIFCFFEKFHINLLPVVTALIATRLNLFFSSVPNS